MEKTKIALVDDHLLFRTGLRTLLSAQPGFEVCGEAGDGAAFLALLAAGPFPDVVLLDIDMPHMNGIEAASRALDAYPDLRIVTLSMFGEEDYYFRMVSLGVKGFLLKNSDIRDVVAAIETVRDGGSYFSQELLRTLVSSLKSTPQPGEGEETLSEREREILLLICKGLSNNEIADQLFISKRTVDKHRANILAKTGSKNTANLVVYAIKHRLVEI
ncbi:MAG: response regulator transcription factor [Rikenellaceae bacterium]|nr:response regulator transcription factor [Rikenellaceae bacterium]